MSLPRIDRVGTAIIVVLLGGYCAQEFRTDTWECRPTQLVLHSTTIHSSLNGCMSLAFLVSRWPSWITARWYGPRATVSPTKPQVLRPHPKPYFRLHLFQNR